MLAIELETQSLNSNREKFMKNSALCPVVSRLNTPKGSKGENGEGSYAVTPHYDLNRTQRRTKGRKDLRNNQETIFLRKKRIKMPQLPNDVRSGSMLS